MLVLLVAAAKLFAAKAGTSIKPGLTAFSSVPDQARLPCQPAKGNCDIQSVMNYLVYFKSNVTEYQIF
jgi:hypothetical protein